MSARRGAALFLFLYLGLRGLLLLEPGYGADLTAYRRWAVTAARHGLAEIYRESDIDYPPLYAYLLLPLGEAYLRLAPGAGTREGGDPAVWVALAKLPPLAFDLLTGALLFAAGLRQERLAAEEAAPGSAPPRWSLLLPGAYLANPAVVFDSGYWGHPDSVHGFFVLAAFLLAERGRAGPAFAALALATLAKPLGAPFFPLLAALVLARSGIRGLARGGAAAAGAGIAVFLPFLLSGQASSVLRRVALDLDAMPYTSVNAHNLWGAFGGWKLAEAPLLGPLSATQLGLGLFGLATLGLLWRAWPVWRAPGDAAAATGILASGGATAFFMLSTHMHENHLFAALPLLALALPAGGRWPRLFVALTAALLLNLVLHDPLIPGRWPFTIGGETGLPRLSHGRVYFAFEWASVRLATAFGLGVAASFAYLVGKAPPPLRAGGRGRPPDR